MTVRGVDGKTGKELRRAPRRAVRYSVWLRFGDGPTVIRCEIGDVSAGGARLALPWNRGVPDQFVLALSQTGPVYRKCRVAWRTDKEVGVSFIS
jgi:PilZ domain